MTQLAISLLDLGLPIARLLEAEDAHRLAITALKTLPLPPRPVTMTVLPRKNPFPPNI